MPFNFLRSGSMKVSKTQLVTGGWDIPAIARLVIRCLQVVMGIVVIGLYAQDLRRAAAKHVHYDSKWMYATITGSIASLWAIICSIPIPIWKPWKFFLMDYSIFLLYLIAFGIFGKMYIKEDPEGNGGIIRMKNAVWVLLTNMFLWFGTATYGAFIFWKARKAINSNAGPQMTQV